ncbi:MAG: hypothetical protein MKZ98_13010, partial [Pseudomonadales bacterium]|nr:hypothetical protein [Pseudomonadales bacterium]
NLVGDIINQYSSDPEYGDYQIWIDGDDNSVSLTLNSELTADPGTFVTQSIDIIDGDVDETLSLMGIKGGLETEINGESVMPFTKGDVTIFISTQLFDEINVNLVS